MDLAIKEEDRFSYADYLKWDDDERWELIDGEAYCMGAAPSRRHQEVLMNISGELRNYLKGKSCKVYPAPFDVRFCENVEVAEDEIFTVLQPDITIVCDKSKLDDRGCKGAPDLVVEILSPGSRRRDLHDKQKVYERYGVKEYWIVQPLEEIITVFTLGESGSYDKAVMYTTGDTLKPSIFDDLELDLTEIFEE